MFVCLWFFLWHNHPGKRFSKCRSPCRDANFLIRRGLRVMHSWVVVANESESYSNWKVYKWHSPYILAYKDPGQKPTFWDLCHLFWPKGVVTSYNPDSGITRPTLDLQLVSHVLALHGSRYCQTGLFLPPVSAWGFFSPHFKTVFLRVTWFCHDNEKTAPWSPHTKKSMSGGSWVKGDSSTLSEISAAADAATTTKKNAVPSVWLHISKYAVGLPVPTKRSSWRTGKSQGGTCQISHGAG